ncbi:MAG: hypothetical protein GY804_00460 [Alphaproteobacteria bacterium]|nr:hypothetical protein [Alphaproteobacteria bacterium]
MTEEEINAELSLVTLAISNLLKTGRRYVVESAGSRREFEMSDLPELRALRNELTGKLADIQGTSGLVLGF